MYKPRKKIFSPEKEPKKFKKYFFILSLLTILVLIFLIKPWGSKPAFDFIGIHQDQENQWWINLSSNPNLLLKENKTGICKIKIDMIQDAITKNLYQQEESFHLFPHSSSSSKIDLSEKLKKFIELGSIKKGSAELSIQLEDCSIFGRSIEEVYSIKIDLTPPSAILKGGPYYFNRGGAGLIIYSVDEDVISSYLKIGDYKFDSYPNPYSTDHKNQFSLFAFSYELSHTTPLELVLEDRAGNQNTKILSGIFIKDHQFRHRKINISDNFINTKVKEIINRTTHLSLNEDQVENFLMVNDQLRQENADFFKKISQNSKLKFLWKDVFVSQPNMAVMAEYADHRNYYYQEKKIDFQVHLGFDMASIQEAKIQAEADGEIIFADYLGIYGNTVIIDHGYKLISVYAHLSEMNVEVGMKVSQGDVIARSGATGLAGGDHLHFSVLINGVQTNPKEFWDKKWTRTHIFNRLQKID